ncbi:endonuclease/exonuclease/phosphatase family protein [Nocardia jejuensis]|uniref:endonuclease/exonuclease/phosphatase family protein n=1 Tax=Nocardia jejuensis TaxID=328049 RepID=UPI000831FF78|nr:endonuclease/exonuclease/phosphatase family protein [Nocardia jejuensis]
MRWKTISAWCAVVPGAVWTLVRLTGFDTWYPMAQLIAFTPYVAALSVLPVVVTVALRQRYAALVAAVIAGALASCVLPRWFADSDPLHGAKGPELRVMSVNVRLGGGDVEQVAKLAEHADVVALQELTPEFAARFAPYFPYHVIDAAPGAGGSGLFSRFPLRDTGVRRNPWGFTQSNAELTDFGVRIESVHPASPYSREATAPWRESYDRQQPATPDGPPRILLGDFNATLDHSVLRTLLDSGYRDAASVLGKGLTGTWGPYDGDPIPPVTLDHILADPRIGIRSLSVLDAPATDHRPLLATLVLPATT